MMQSVAVFCGSSSGTRDEFRRVAARLGSLLARQGLRLVYGGSRVGLMGVVADACLAAGGSVTGVIPQALVDREIAHGGLTELLVVESMHQRKALMADRACAFIALPGGLGTWEEILEAATWTQLGLQRKACGLVNVAGYYDGLLAQADRAVEEGFLSPAHRSLLVSDPDPETVLSLVRRAAPPLVSKWLGPADAGR